MARWGFSTVQDGRFVRALKSRPKLTSTRHQTAADRSNWPSAHPRLVPLCRFRLPGLDVGHWNGLQFGPRTEHPHTRSTARCCGKTRSGVSGLFRSYSRRQEPLA